MPALAKSGAWPKFVMQLVGDTSPGVITKVNGEPIIGMPSRVIARE